MQILTGFYFVENTQLGKTLHKKGEYPLEYQSFHSCTDFCPDLVLNLKLTLMCAKKNKLETTIAKRAATRSKATTKPKQPVKTVKRVMRRKTIKPTALKQVRHLDLTVSNAEKCRKTDANVTLQRRSKYAPSDIEFQLQPLEGEDLVFHIMPGFTSKESALGQLSVSTRILNFGTEDVDLDRVIVQYKKGNNNVNKSIYLPSDSLVIEKGWSRTWQNSRDYHKNGDVVFMQAPFPTKVKISFYFKGYRSPLSITKNIKPYHIGFGFPFKAKDFETNEHVTGYSMHGGGSQVFAYDFGTNAYEDKAWRHTKPGKDGSKNEHFRIWGKPVYAMADGTVLRYENNIPNNWKPAANDDDMEKQKDELWGSFDYGGAGNHFYIKHGSLVGLYAHLQKGSLTSSFRKKGAVVKKGDLLGLAGNSGNSSAPHLHNHIKTYVSDDAPDSGVFRPLLFNEGYAIGMHAYATPESNINWSPLTTKGIPGLKDKACFISETHPYCKYPKHWGEVTRHGVPEEKYQEVFDSIWPCGYYPVWVDGYDVNGKTYFNVIFRPSNNVGWVARHNMGGGKYQTEFNKWTRAGYRLIHVNSYLLHGKLRYAAIWKKDSSVAFTAYHGRSLSWHEKNFDHYRDAGWVPRNVSCTSLNGKIYVTALWEKQDTGGFYLRPVMTLQQYKDYFETYTNQKKFKLVYLDAYTYNGAPRLSGIWYKKADDYSSWWAKHHLNSGEFQLEFDAYLEKGFLTRCIAGYEHGKKAQFEGIWSK
ncbi:peptidoglycan DD-metalloendopeptidase family protein [Altibacter sp. HG106]|uniref:peptidoglycan DD-metalloendopeptidase family protein n=1 Tax=Altibacter sp. HG106 TaxID=3023937 RepID=UPI00234FF660|nr:peptidoglycan DD-metalloendopeptidase family protein [Altibacter sp. HG106]